MLKHPSELLLFGLGQLGQLRWWGEQSDARSAQRRIPTAGKHDGLDTAICGRRPPSCEARSLEMVDHRGDVGRIGGWPTVVAIYAAFVGLALTGLASGGPLAARRSGVRTAGRVAKGVIGAMFVGTYLGQLPRSAWHAVPASLVGAAVAANLRGGIHPFDVSAGWVADPKRAEAAAP